MIVELETVEVTKRLADGVDYTFWTFGGNVPGSFIRIREGDLVEFTLKNHPNSTAAHNIDLHAVTGPAEAPRPHSPAPARRRSSPSGRSTPASTSTTAPWHLVDSSRLATMLDVSF